MGRTTEDIIRDAEVAYKAWCERLEMLDDDNIWNEDEINIDYSTSMKDNNILQEDSTKQSRKSSTNEKHNSFYSQRANIELQNNNNIKRNRKESIDIQFTSAKKKDEDTRSEGKNNFYAP